MAVLAAVERFAGLRAAGMETTTLPSVCGRAVLVSARLGTAVEPILAHKAMGGEHALVP